MAKNTTPTEEPAETPTEFPVTLDEFLTEIPAGKVEIKAAFSRLMKNEGIGGHRQRAEWRGMLEQFRTMPVGTAWKEWTDPDKGGK
jgi:hypothetical protein